MRLLLVKLRHIGDALLLTPTLAAVRQSYPGAEIWVVVRQGTEGILAGCSAIDVLRTAAPPEKCRRGPQSWRRDARLLFELRRQRFDDAIDLTHGDRGRLLTAWSGARRRGASDAVYRVPWYWRWWFNRLAHRDWRDDHRVEADFRIVNELLPLKVAEPPPLVFERARVAPCDLGVAPGEFIVMHPGTRWQRKRWLFERWVAVGRELLTRVKHLVISVGPDPEEVQLGDALGAALGPQALTTRGGLSWAQLAGLLSSARLFVGVDTAAMHLAAACQCPTVALFAASVAAHWRPWRVAHRLVGAAAGIGDKPAPDGMTGIEPEQVLAACRELLSARGAG